MSPTLTVASFFLGPPWTTSITKVNAVAQMSVTFATNQAVGVSIPGVPFLTFSGVVKFSMMSKGSPFEFSIFSYLLVTEEAQRVPCPFFGTMRLFG